MRRMVRQSIHASALAILSLALFSCSDARKEANPLSSDSETEQSVKLASRSTLAATESASALTVTEEYVDLTASIVVPATVVVGEPFSVQVNGDISGGALFGVYAYGVYQDAEWSYSANHMAVVSGGTPIAVDGFNFGSTFSASYEQIADVAGVHTYTFVFGQRSFGHGFYDIVVEAEVQVGPGEPCESGWRPPLSDLARASSTIPLKFDAEACDGTPYSDESTVVTVTNETGASAAEWQVTGNPNTGIDVKDGSYHVNWSTRGLAAGVYDVTVTFGTGSTLFREMTLR